MQDRNAVRARARSLALRAALGSVLAAAALHGAAAESPRILRVEALEDPSRQLTAEAVAADTRFRPLAGGRLNAGFSSSAFWLRLELPGAAAAGERAVVEIAAPVLDRVEAFARTDGPWRKLGVSGDGIPFAERAIPHRQPAFPVALAPVPTTVLVRIAGEGTLNAPVRVWSEAGFFANAADDNLFFGVYFGFLAAMLTYNLFLFGAARDRAYLWYVAYVGALMLLQAKLAGYADEYLWPEAPGLANPANLLSFAAVLIFGAQFTKSFLRGASVGRLMPRLVTAAQGAAVLAAAAMFLISYSTATQAMLVVALAVIVLLVDIMVRAFRRGFRPARFILLAFAALAPGGVAYILRVQGVFGPEIPADRILDLATAGEALLLSFALADRINLLEAERRRAERALTALELRLPGALLDAQETERHRIAAELHDAVGQNLVVVGSRIRALQGPEPSAALADIAEVNRETLEQVRAMARSLHPAELERLGLSQAVRIMAERAVGGSGIALDLAVEPVDAANAPERQIHLYRIAQEAVTNAVKHSRARRIRIALSPGIGRVRLAVADDGVGFDPGASGATMGLATMRQRATLLEAELTLATAPGRGTEVRLDAPLGSQP